MGSLKPKKAKRSKPLPVKKEPPTPMGRSKYQHLLDDRDVRRWFLYECSGSEITGRERLRRLGAICLRYDTTPQKLGRMNRKQAKNFILDMVVDMERAGMKANYIRNFGKAIQEELESEVKRSRTPEIQPATDRS